MQNKTRRYRKAVRKNLKSFGLTLREVERRMSAAGQKVHYQTIRDWFGYENNNQMVEAFVFQLIQDLKQEAEAKAKALLDNLESMPEAYPAEKSVAVAGK